MPSCRAQVEDAFSTFIRYRVMVFMDSTPYSSPYLSAFVIFENVQDAARTLIALDGRPLLGNHLKITMASHHFARRQLETQVVPQLQAFTQQPLPSHLAASSTSSTSSLQQYSSPNFTSSTANGSLHETCASPGEPRKPFIVQRRC